MRFGPSDIKDEGGKVLITKQDIKERLECYFHKQFNEKYGTFLYFDRLNTTKVDQNYSIFCKIQEFEVKEVLKWITSGKEVGLDNILIEV